MRPGWYFHYANQTVVPDLFKALDALEKAEYAQTFKFVGEDRYQYALGPALLLLMLSLLLSTRRGAAAALTLTLGLMSAAPSHATESDKRTQAEARRAPTLFERENPDISDGRELAKEGKIGEALQAFQAARSSRPEHAIIWYDVGLAQAIIGQYEDAMTSLDRALSAMAETDPELEADIHYTAGTSLVLWGQSLLKKAENAAQVNAGAKRPDPAPGAKPQTAPKADKKSKSAPQKEAAEHFRAAVERLQSALVKAPQRADIKRNLELARMLAYPPCERRDRAQEPNDDPAQAKPLKLSDKERETKFSLLSCPVDRDLFQLPLRAGDRVTVSVDARAPEEGTVDPLDLAP